jgi:hypothetical protein
MARKTKSTKKRGGCWKGGAGCSVVGGRRSRRMRGGAYGVGNAIIPGAIEYNSVDTATPVNPVTGAAMPDIYDVQRGGRRRTRKTAKKHRRGTRKMKGGANQMSMGGVGYGYTGTGAGGLADATQYVKPGNPI